jgi:hypothetical protein
MERGGEETVAVPCPDCGQGTEESVQRVAHGIAAIVT